MPLPRVSAWFFGLAALALASAPAKSQAAIEAPFLTHEPASGWDATRARGQSYEVDFVTSQGTWMAVDTSPDGAWIVFDLLGHIYRLPASGGTAVNLTAASGVALNYHPRISPDGTSITFVSDRGGQASLWLMDADGSNPRPVFADPVSRITSPAWLPDGSSIVAVREFPTYSMHRRSARIWRFPVAPGADAPEELVGSPSGTQAYWPSPSPDGRSLYYMASTFAEPLHGLQRYQNIASVDLVSRGRRSVTPRGGPREYREGQVNELAPEASPDGRYLAFARRIPGGTTSYRGHRLNERNALWLLDLQTGEERVLAQPITLDMQGAHGMKNLSILPGYAWFKDGRSLAIWNDGRLERIWLDGRREPIPFEARVKRRVSEKARAATADLTSSTFSSRHLRRPSLSPKSGFAVFEAAGGIWTADTRRSRAVATPVVPWRRGAAAYMPDLSPDGAKIAYVEWNDAGLGAVVTCNLGDCAPTKVTRQRGVYLYPTWDHAGRNIHVFRSQQSDVERVAAGEATGFDLIELSGEGERVIERGVVPAPLARGPDRRLFRIDREGESDVQKALASGQAIPVPSTLLSSFEPGAATPKRRHIRFPAATAAAPSPTGALVAFIEQDELHVAALVRNGAVYDVAEANRWNGEPLPQAVVKENPAHDVRTVSFGGASDLRWVDEDRLIYAAANRLTIYDTRTGRRQTVEVDVRLPRSVAAPSDRIAFTGARIIPMVGDTIIERGSVVVEGGRLACVGNCKLAGARVIDATGKTIIPGLIDVHAHGGFDSTSIIPEHLAPQALYLAHGVTTTLDPSVASEAFFPVAELIEAGRIVGPRSFATGEPLQPQSPRTGPSDEREAEALISRLAAFGARSAKIFLEPRRDQRQMLVEWARRHKLSVTNEGADLYYNVGAILDGGTGFEHPMQNLVLYDDAVQFFGRTGAVYSPTLVVSGAGRWAEEFQKAHDDLSLDPVLQRLLPWRQLAVHLGSPARPVADYSFPILAESVKDIRHAGGYATLGGHGELWGRDTHWEMRTYAAAASPIEVLAMGTRDGAWMIGLEKQIGSLEAGKVADLVVLDANPLDDIRNAARVSQVMKAGILYEVPSLDRIWPSPESYGAPPWQSPAGLRPVAMTSTQGDVE